jgi:hypothetical protein
VEFRRLEEVVELHTYLLEGDRIFRIYFLKRMGQLWTYMLEVVEELHTCTLKEAEELRMYLLEGVAVLHSYLSKGTGEPLSYLLEGMEARVEESQPYLSEGTVQILPCLSMGIVRQDVMDVLQYTRMAVDVDDDI